MCYYYYENEKNLTNDEKNVAKCRVRQNSSDKTRVDISRLSRPYHNLLLNIYRRHPTIDH